MPTEKKIKEIEVLTEKFSNAKAIYLSDFKGMTVKQMTIFRKKMREAGLEYRVVKNNLAKRAIKKSNCADITEFFTGPVAIAFSYEDPVIPAKLIKESKDDIGLPIFKGGLLEGKIITADEAFAIAKLPSKEVLLAQVTGTFAAPLTNFMGIGKNIISSFIRVIISIKNSKEKE